ncbi:MAG: hypothetical protein U0575_11980 [Phycisphaerales bacterium]
MTQYVSAIAAIKLPLLSDGWLCGVLGLGVPLLGLFVWWIAACHRYLRLHAATAVGVVVSIIGVLVAVIGDGVQLWQVFG